MKKLSININELRLKVRKHWVINPVTRVVPKRKKKSRKVLKQEFKKEIDY